MRRPPNYQRNERLVNLGLFLIFCATAIVIAFHLADELGAAEPLDPDLVYECTDADGGTFLAASGNGLVWPITSTCTPIGPNPGPDVYEQGDGLGVIVANPDAIRIDHEVNHDPQAVMAPAPQPNLPDPQLDGEPPLDPPVVPQPDRADEQPGEPLDPTSPDFRLDPLTTPLPPHVEPTAPTPHVRPGVEQVSLVNPYAL